MFSAPLEDGRVVESFSILERFAEELEDPRLTVYVRLLA
jgi:hypothetical protein